MTFSTNSYETFKKKKKRSQLSCWGMCLSSLVLLHSPTRTHQSQVEIRLRSHSSLLSLSEESNRVLDWWFFSENKKNLFPEKPICSSLLVIISLLPLDLEDLQKTHCFWCGLIKSYFAYWFCKRIQLCYTKNLYRHGGETVWPLRMARYLPEKRRRWGDNLTGRTTVTLLASNWQLDDFESNFKLKNKLTGRVVPRSCQKPMKV